MNNKEIRQKLETKFKCVSFNKGLWKVKRTYFWGMFDSGDKLFPVVKGLFPDAILKECGNHYHSFVGGAKTGSAQDSYYWITFEIPKSLNMNAQDKEFKEWMKAPVTTQDLMKM